MCKLLVDYLFCVNKRPNEPSVQCLHACNRGCICMIFRAFNKCACPIKCDQMYLHSLLCIQTEIDSLRTLDRRSHFHILMSMHSLSLNGCIQSIEWGNFLMLILWRKKVLLARNFINVNETREKENKSQYLKCFF